MIRYLINRPVGVLMSFAIIVLLGIISFNDIPVSLLPNHNISKFDVIIDNNENSPEIFDAEIVERIRNNLLQINNITELNSYSDDKKAVIELLFDFDSNINLTFFEVNEKIDEVLSELPYPINRPKVVRYNLADIPSMYLSIYQENQSDETFSELSSFVEEKFKNKLEQSKEIAFVDISGLSENIINISINQNLLNSLGINLNDIQKSLNDSNFSFGEIEVTQNHFVYKWSLENTINTIDDIRNIIIEIGTRRIRLSDIAKVDNQVNYKSEYYYNNQKSISLAVIKNPNSKESHFAEKLDNLIEEVNIQYPNIKISKVKDQSLILKETLKSLKFSLLLGLFCAVFITFFFLKSFKNGILIFIAVITSLAIDFFLFFIFKISINLISISGLILGIGLMIDNIIIVLDNIEQKISELKSVYKGNIIGVNEIISALLSSALTTCSIFIPLVFLSGVAGILFYDQAISISITLFSSFLVSIILIPTIYALLNKNKFVTRKDNNLITIYKYIYIKLTNHKVLVFSSLAVLVILGGFILRKMDKEMISTISSNELAFKIEWNDNYTNDYIIKQSKEILNEIEGNFHSTEFYLNQQQFLSKTQRNDVEDYESLFSLNLKNKDDKNLIKKQLTTIVNKSYQDAELIFLKEENALNSVLLSEGYNLKIVSYDKALTSEIISEFLVQQYPDLIYKSIGKTKRLELVIDDEKLLLYNIDKKLLIEYLKLSLGKEKLLDINYGKSYVPVVLNSRREDINSFLNSNYMNNSGEKYQLKEIVDFKYKEYSKAVEADIGGVANILYINTNYPNKVIKIIKEKFPEFNISFKGGYLNAEKLKQEFLYIGIITLILLYLILSIQFESLKLPFIILIEIPIDIAFAILILYVTGQTLNIMSYIGLIIMSGIIINDSILKIDLINKLYKKERNIDYAIHKASERRLNAILMTSLTTLFAVVPTLFQNDISAELQSPLIIALIGGLILGTMISIFIIPMLFKKFML